MVNGLYIMQAYSRNAELVKFEPSVGAAGKTGKGYTVTVTGISNKNSKSVKVKQTVQINGVTFKINAVGKSVRQIKICLALFCGEESGISRYKSFISRGCYCNARA